MATRQEDEQNGDDSGSWAHPPEGEQEKSAESEETLSDDEMGAERE